jgi:hypothetical protein
VSRLNETVAVYTSWHASAASGSGLSARKYFGLAVQAVRERRASKHLVHQDVDLWAGDEIRLCKSH